MKTTPFDPERRIGTVTQVLPDAVFANLEAVTQRTGRLLSGMPLRGGQVGDFVVVDCDSHALLGRILEVKLPERERLDIEQQLGHTPDPHPLAKLHLLGALQTGSEKVISGIPNYPTLGASVFAASAALVSHFASSFSVQGESDTQSVTLKLGCVRDSEGTSVEIKAEQVFGRHCAILGATGGGKSTTVARMLQELTRAQLHPKIILLDAAGEYQPMGAGWRRVHLCSHALISGDDEGVFIPYDQLEEGDFYALFSPSGRTQGPKMREAIRSLRLVNLLKSPALRREYTGIQVVDGILKKATFSNTDFRRAVSALSSEIESPTTPFEVKKLAAQIYEECVYEPGGDRGRPDDTRWGNYDGASYGNCLYLVTRINGIVHSPELRPLFEAGGTNLFQSFEAFSESSERVLHICLDKLPSDFQAREILMNLIGRKLLKLARSGEFASHCPLLVFLDEAHNFLNKHVGEEEFRFPLDAFEKIAKEGRKFWLNLVLATQQPRDIPPGILSQMGTLIVHRLINDADRKVVETACGQLDAAAARFLPSLAPGEAAIIGVDFPIPLTIQIEQPPMELRPNSEGPKFSMWLQQRAARQRTAPRVASPPVHPIASPAAEEAEPEEDDIPF